MIWMSVDCYVKPEIMQDDAELKAKADAINQKLSANLTMDFGTDRKEVLDKNHLKRLGSRSRRWKFCHR